MLHSTPWANVFNVRFVVKIRRQSLRERISANVWSEFYWTAGTETEWLSGNSNSRLYLF